MLFRSEHLQQSIENREHPVATLNQGEDTMKSRQQNKIIEENLKKAHANLLIQRRAENPSAGGATFKQDEEGMKKAYSDTTYPGVYYDQSTGTMYVKGTVNAQDWYDDFTKIPAWGDIHDAVRMKDAEKAYADLLQRGMPVNRVVGHSPLQLQKNKNLEFFRTFRAPVVDWDVSVTDPLNLRAKGAEDRYRHPLDPVSILDRKAK